MAQNKDGVILTGDGRCDSPGHSAKFGSYTVIEQQMNRVLDFQLVQVIVELSAIQLDQRKKMIMLFESFICSSESSFK